MNIEGYKYARVRTPKGTYVIKSIYKTSKGVYYIRHNKKDVELYKSSNGSWHGYGGYSVFSFTNAK